MNYTQNEKIEQVTDTTMVVGIDIGSQTHYARAFDNRGRELTKRVYSFQNDIEGFNSFDHWAETLKREHKKTEVLIGCEPTGDIVNIPLHFFLKDVRPMQPPVMNRSIAVS